MLLADGDADGDYGQAAGSGATSPPASLLATAGSADALIQYTSGTTGRPKGATFTHDAERATAEELRTAALASGLTRFKCPVRIDFEPELPRNAIGKIQKQVLRSRYMTPAK